tara:strand:+ start:2256 stop:2774 length:519 start_codon:yes stop_codon:yes gene_type:complete
MAGKDKSVSRINQAMKTIYNSRTPIAKFKSGGRKYAQRGIETTDSPMDEGLFKNDDPSNFGEIIERTGTLTQDQRNALRFDQALRLQQQKQQYDMLMQMKMQNESLMQQNELLKTQIQKSDLINSARTTKQTPGAKTTPKKRGGSNKRVRAFVAGNAGNVMKRGGSYSKKRR